MSINTIIVEALRAASELGARLDHDYCLVRLGSSHILWEQTERRLRAAARGDFLLVLDMTSGNAPGWQLTQTLATLRRYRPGTTPVVVVHNAAGPNESLGLTTLDVCDLASTNLPALVLVGSTQSQWVEGRMMAADRSVPLVHSQSGGQTPFADPTHPTTYPVVLTNLRGARVVIIGGGAVGERKSRSLLAVGALLQLISPEVTPGLRTLAEAGSIHWQQRPYAPGDLAAHLPLRLVFAATNNRTVNALVAEEAHRLGLLCNIADDPEASDLHLPAVHRRHGLVVAVSTNGQSPASARALRDAIAAWLDSNAYLPNT